MQRINILDYWRMYHARGLRTPVKYFLECHLYDLINKTETHRWLPKEDHDENPEGFEHSTCYRCSWTSVIRDAFRVTHEFLKEKMTEYTFVDVGCGKGKVLLVWRQECRRNGVDQKIFGVDYYRPFVETAKANYLKVYGQEPSIFLSNIANVETDVFGERNIAYLFNPFDEEMLDDFLCRFSKANSIIIYNVPVHFGLLSQHGYKKLYEKRGFHPQAHTMIFSNH
jgi:SAM-dependent methyltransferase